MYVNRINDNTTFGVKVSAHFNQIVQNHYNYNRVPNKLKRMYEYNQKVEKYAEFGYDNYTIDYEKKLYKNNWEHYLVAIDENNKHKVILFKRDTLVKIINRFMEMNKHEFNKKFLNK